MMGGVSTDINGATPLAGLYAAGEGACVSMNGASRLGSNSLPELLVFGARAGKGAAEFASSAKASSNAVLAQAIDEQRRIEEQFLRKSGGLERTSTLREEMQTTMEASAGIYRTESSLAAGAATLRTLQEPSANLTLDDHSLTFNTALIAALDLSFILAASEPTVHPPLPRPNSPGPPPPPPFPLPTTHTR